MIPTLRIRRNVIYFSFFTILLFSGWTISYSLENSTPVYSWNDSGVSSSPYSPVQAETDFTPPSSQASGIIPYWRTSTPVNIHYTATDDQSVFDVTLNYRKANLGSQTFGNYTQFSTITAGGVLVTGNIPFTGPQGPGHYELYTIAQDTSGLVESAPGIADATFGLITSLTKLLPDIKFFTNVGHTNVFNLDDYHPAAIWELSTTGSLANLSISSSHQVDYLPPYQSITGLDTVTFVSDSIAAYYSIAKYSSFLLSRFPRALFYKGTPVENNSLALVNYTSPGLPPSWPSPELRLSDISDFGKISASINSNQLTINATTTLNSSAEIIVTATDTSNPDDWDKEIVRVYEVLNNFGLFNSASDTTQWAYENAPGLTNKPTIGFLNTFNNASGILQLTFSTPSQGIKMTLGIANWLNSTLNQWYTVRMRVMSDLPNNAFDPNIFIYNRIYPSSFNVSDHAILSTPTSWTWLENSIYCDFSSKLFPQITIKNRNSLGNIYIDAIEIIPIKPGFEFSHGITQINYAGADWDSSSDTTLWAFESIPDGTFANYAVSNGKLNISFNGNGNQGVKLTGLSSPGHPATSQIIPGRSSGMKLNVSSSGALNQPVIILTVFGIDSANNANFKELGATASVFRMPLNGQLEAAYIPTQPYIYEQVQVKNASSAQISLDNTYLHTDSDPDYYWDHSLFE